MLLKTQLDFDQAFRELTGAWAAFEERIAAVVHWQDQCRSLDEFIRSDRIRDVRDLRAQIAAWIDRTATIAKQFSKLEHNPNPCPCERRRAPDGRPLDAAVLFALLWSNVATPVRARAVWVRMAERIEALCTIGQSRMLADTVAKIDEYLALIDSVRAERGIR